MKFFLRLICLIPLFFFLIVALKVLYDNNPIRFGDDLGGYLGLFCISIFGIIIFFIEQHYYQKEKRISQFIVTGIAILAFITMLLPIGKRELIEASKTALKVSKGFMRFEFKQNNAFKLQEGEGMSTVTYYGKYVRAGDTIKIEGSNYDGFEKKLPEFGIIRNDTMLWNKFDTMLVEREIK